MIKQTMLGRREPRSAEPPSQRIDTIKHAPDGNVPEKRHAENIGSLSCIWTHAAGHEYKGETTIGRCEACCSLHVVDSEITLPVVDPAEVTVAVEIAERPGSSGSDDCVECAEEDHPVAIQLDGFLPRDAPGSRRRRLRPHGFQCASKDRLPARVGEQS